MEMWIFVVEGFAVELGILAFLAFVYRCLDREEVRQIQGGRVPANSEAVAEKLLAFAGR
jgi:hypothetical protein